MRKKQISRKPRRLEKSLRATPLFAPVSHGLIPGPRKNNNLATISADLSLSLSRRSLWRKKKERCGPLFPAKPRGIERAHPSVYTYLFRKMLPPLSEKSRETSGGRGCGTCCEMCDNLATETKETSAPHWDLWEKERNGILHTHTRVESLLVCACVFYTAAIIFSHRDVPGNRRGCLCVRHN